MDISILKLLYSGTVSTSLLTFFEVLALFITDYPIAILIHRAPCGTWSFQRLSQMHHSCVNFEQEFSTSSELPNVSSWPLDLAKEM
jgi:hypothetical protein